MSDLSNVEISYVVPLYIENNSSNIVQKFIKYYEAFDEEILQKIHFIFINDCSPVDVSIRTEKLNYTLAKITTNISWNQGGARNLGVSISKSSKILLTDFDHFFSEDCLKYLLKLQIPKKIYTFRRTNNGEKVNSAPNIFFTSQSVFYKSLGVDEEFCGNYGYEDIYFRCLQKKLKTRFKKIRKYSVILKEHKESKDKKQHYLERDTRVNKELFDTKIKQLENKDFFKSHSRKRLNFDWELS